MSFQERTRPALKKADFGPQKSSVGIPSRRSVVPLKSLAPKLNFATSGQFSENGFKGNRWGKLDEDTYGDSPLVDDPTKAWGSGAGTFARVSDYLLYRKIYDNVDSVLYFPSFFHRHNIQGVTNARLVLNEDGVCDWKHTDIKGTNAYIQLYVLSVLKKACTQNYKTYLKDRKLTNVDLSFRFDLTENMSKEQIDQHKYIVGNTLLFFRNSTKSLLEWEFGPFQGLFPIPAVYLNIGWIKENWEKIVESKDPIRLFQNEFGG